MASERTGDNDRETVARVRDLVVRIPTKAGVVTPSQNVSFEVAAGETLGVVGETGSGKSVTCRSLLGLTPTNDTEQSGTIGYPPLGVDDVLSLARSELRKYWGRYVSLIPQNPMNSLNPLRRVGDQIAEAVAATNRMSRRSAKQRSLELMESTGIADAAARYASYPHQFSGGMLQRVLIAIALAGDPRLIIADEPTTALDVVVQHQILQLLADLQRRRGMALVLISHDLAVISEVCDRVAVMYAGEIVEVAPTKELLLHPKHPYTSGLIHSIPSVHPAGRQIPAIAGKPPRLVHMPPGCRFADRCPFVEGACRQWDTELIALPGTRHSVRCRRHHELTLPGAEDASALTNEAAQSAPGEGDQPPPARPFSEGKRVTR